MPKLTKRTIDATDPQATEFFLWDEGIPGFGLRVMPSGRKSFVVQFRAGRRARRMSLGPSTVLTCDQARTRAITIIAAVKNGEEERCRVPFDPQARDVMAQSSAWGGEGQRCGGADCSGDCCGV